MLRVGHFGIIAASLLLPLAAAAAVQDDAGMSQEQFFSELQVAVEDLRATLLRPGGVVDGWNVGGADPGADVRAMGADRYYLLSRTPEDDSVTILTDRPIADFAPTDWQAVDSYGAHRDLDGDVNVEFTPYSHRYVLAVRVVIRRERDADCSTNIEHAMLYEIPDAESDPEDETIPILFRMLILALEDQTLCVRFDGDRLRGYRARSFLPDGTSLPELDRADELMTIVPAAPVDRLIAYRARASEGTPTL